MCACCLEWRLSALTTAEKAALMGALPVSASGGPAEASVREGDCL